jgi:hypothetical protein
VTHPTPNQTPTASTFPSILNIEFFGYLKRKQKFLKNNTEKTSKLEKQEATAKLLMGDEAPKEPIAKNE